MTAKGYSVSKNDSGWVVMHWGIPTPAPTPEDAPAPPPEVKTPHVSTLGLLPYQVPAARTLAKALLTWGSGLDGSDTGVGKTYTALAVMKALDITPTVICPKSMTPTWERVAQHFRMTIHCINYEKVRNGNTRYGKWTTVESGSRSMERFMWNTKVVKGLILDECHRCKGQKTSNAELMIGAKIQQVPTIVLSATAVTSPLDMRALGYLLGLHGLHDYWTWIETHGCYRNRWDGWEFGGTDADMERIRSQIFGSGKGVRIRVSELGDQFPKTLITTRLVDVASPEKVTEAYTHLKAVFDAIEAKKVEDSEKAELKKEQDLGTAEHLTAILRALQISEAQKIPHLIEITEDALAEGRSVVIGVNYMDTLKALETALGKSHKVSVVHGGQTQKGKRDQNINDFQFNRSHVMIMTVAGTEGIGLHDLYDRPRTSVLSPGHSAVKVKQFFGRIWRSGGKSGSIQIVVYARGTWEEKVADNLEAKLRRLKIFNDGLAELDLTDKDLIG